MVDSGTIRLRIISYHRLSKTQEAEKLFDTQGEKTLGRGADCDWVLPDPSRVVSGIHATIAFRDGRFVVRDESTNGLFLNGELDPLGKDNAAELNVGDVLFLGEYEVEVVAIGDEPSSPKTVEPEPQNTVPESPNPISGTPKTGTLNNHLGLSSDAFSVPAITPIAQKPAPQNHTAIADQPFIPEQFDDHLSAFALTEKKTDASPLAPAPTTPSEEAVSPGSERAQESPVAKPEPHEATDSTPPAQPTIPTAPMTAGSDDAFFRAYVEALGIAQEPGLQGLSASVLGQKAGQLTRELLEGLLQLMRTREAAKSAFRAAQTRIRVGDNNPLKFSATADDAVFNLLLQSRSSYLEPVAAVRESYQDISRHQAGLLNGMQSVFAALMTHFDPAQIRQQEGGQSLMGRLSPSARKAAAWDRYEALYAMLSDQHGDSLHHHFSDEFVNAYEQAGTPDAHRE